MNPTTHGASRIYYTGANVFDLSVSTIPPTTSDPLGPGPPKTKTKLENACPSSRKWSRSLLVLRRWIRAPASAVVGCLCLVARLCLHRRAGSHRGWLPEHLSARTCLHPTQPSDRLPQCGCCCSWRRMAETQVASSAAASSERCWAPMSPDVVNRGGVALYWFRTTVVRVFASCSV